MRLLSAFLLLAGLGFADTVTFRDGHTVNGSFLGGDARTIRIAVGDRVENYPIGDVVSLSFGGPVSAAPVRDERRDDRRDERRAVETRPDTRRDDQRQDFGGGATLASGTVLMIRMVDSVDSERDKVGQTFRASLDEPVVDAGGNTLIPRGADVFVKLVDDQQSGKIAGRTVLTLDLVSVRVNGRDVEIDTQSITEQSGSRTARSGKVIGGTAALGAIIGAIAGGGKGAAIGAGAGAGAGTVAEVATKGQRVRIPSETRLTFTLQQPVRL
jgi:hypothetical protein